MSFTHDSRELAETYDRLSDSQFEGGKFLVERLGLGAGARVLDVGCGTGRLARWIAEVVGPKGSVVGIDPLAERVAIARANGGDIAFEVGQAEDLSRFAPESFDAVCMSAVFHWVENKAKALAEVHRVLRAGGRLGVTTLPRELMPSSTVRKTLQPIVAEEPYAKVVDLLALPIASRVCTTTDVVMLVVASGLELTELHVMARSWTRPSGEEVIDFLESSSFGNFLRMAPEELRPSLRRDLAAAFEAKKGPGGVVVRDWGLAFVAKKP